jgi:hypothetical protein
VFESVKQPFRHMGDRSLRRGRPSVAWREDRVVFWSAISCGSKTEVAAIEAKVSSPVAFR